jgi:gamma-glutamyl phosphate reductase
MNADAKSYIEEIVDPTIADFRDHPASRRHAFLACVVTFHCIDYIMHPKKSKNLRRLFRKENLDFATVDRVAHAVKHVRSDGDSKSSEIQTRSLHVTSIFERPPALAGVMQCGLSRFGDFQGGVEIWEEEGSNLLSVVTKAAEFLRSKM